MKKITILSLLLLMSVKLHALKMPEWLMGHWVDVSKIQKYFFVDSVEQMKINMRFTSVIDRCFVDNENYQNYEIKNEDGMILLFTNKNNKIEVTLYRIDLEWPVVLDYSELMRKRELYNLIKRET